MDRTAIRQEGAVEETASFGYWLRRRRKALDLTQDALARQAGCAADTIKKIEADARRPSRQLAERLADCLAVPPEQRAAFLRAARAELAVDRLELTTRPVEQPPPLAVPPGGTITFLFTDIEGSTALWERDREAMSAALARHDAILRASVAARGGEVVKTLGDGMHAAFASAADALGAAHAAQGALVTEPWGAVGSIRVRMALHSGAAEARDGDYYGPALNRAARLLEAASGGRSCCWTTSSRWRTRRCSWRGCWRRRPRPAGPAADAARHDRLELPPAERRGAGALPGARRPLMRIR
ncbi:MAG TPA: helix-turn-helix domain-containing protein [Roseiflexaceae bacterium]|nr:helix-turn-helix domain-containing protein [Roseiflexaceae bacterium]